MTDYISLQLAYDPCLSFSSIIQTSHGRNQRHPSASFTVGTFSSFYHRAGKLLSEK